MNQDIRSFAAGALLSLTLVLMHQAGAQEAVLFEDLGCPPCTCPPCACDEEWGPVPEEEVEEVELVLEPTSPTSVEDALQKIEAAEQYGERVEKVLKRQKEVYQQMHQQQRQP